MTQYGRPCRSPWTKSVWSSFGRTVMGKAIWENPFEKRLGEGFQIGNAYSYPEKKGYACLKMWTMYNWLERNKIYFRCGKYSTKNLIWENQHLSLIMKTSDVLKDTVKQVKILLTITEPCLNPDFPQVQLKNYHARKICVSLHGPSVWKVMPRNVWNDIVSWRTKRLNNSTKYQLHALMTIISKKKNWNPWENCQKYALKLFWGVYNGHVLDDLMFCGQWTNLHDRSQNGPKLVANEYLVWSPTFFIHVSTNNVVMWETLQNNADGDFFKTPILQDILRIFNLHPVEHCAYLEVIRLFKLVGCEKQTSVSRSSTESQIISLDAGLRIHSIPALDLWDLIVTVLHWNTNQSKLVRGNLSTSLTRKSSPGKFDDLDNVDFISSNVNSSHKEALLYIFEDNEAVIKMIIKGRSPTMRHVSQRVALDWLFNRIKLDPKIQNKYIDTKNQIADILTKGNFTRDEWNHPLRPLRA